MNRKQSYNRGPRINEQIKAEYIELIDETGKHYTSFNTSEAIQRAADLKLSLVEIKFDPRRPVCKILDYGKYQYNKRKQESENRKKQRNDVEKEIQIGANTAANDLTRSIQKARELLSLGNKLKIVLTFKGRTVHHKAQGNQNMQDFINSVSDIAKVFAPPSSEGRKSICKLVPLKTHGMEQQKTDVVDEQ